MKNDVNVLSEWNEVVNDISRANTRLESFDSSRKSDEYTSDLNDVVDRSKVLEAKLNGKLRNDCTLVIKNASDNIMSLKMKSALHDLNSMYGKTEKFKNECLDFKKVTLQF